MSTLQRRDTDHPRTSSQRSNGRRGGLFRSAAVLVVITALMVQSGGSVSGQIAAKGATVVKIDFGSGGKKLGEYRQTGTMRWGQFTLEGTLFSEFNETGRDEWSVYLIDVGPRGYKVTLDLFQKRLNYTAPGQPEQYLYDILAASTDPALTPTTVARPTTNAPPVATATTAVKTPSTTIATAATTAPAAGSTARRGRMSPSWR